MRPPHVINEVVPDVSLHRTNVCAVTVLIANAIPDDLRSAMAAERKQTVLRHQNVKIRLSFPISRVVKIKDHSPRIIHWWNCEVIRKQDRMRPPLVPTLNAVGVLKRDIVAPLRTATLDVAIARFRMQAQPGPAIAPDIHHGRPAREPLLDPPHGIVRHALEWIRLGPQWPARAKRSAPLLARWDSICGGITCKNCGRRAAVAEESVAVPLEDVPFTDEALAVSEAVDAAPEAEDAGAPSPPPLPHAVSAPSRNNMEIPVKLNLWFTIFFQEKTAAAAYRAGPRTVNRTTCFLPECPGKKLCETSPPGLLMCDGSVVPFVNEVIH
jgi:hypothetical protein